MSLLHHTATVQATPAETALRVARMQPLHLWHVDAIKQAFQSGIKKLLIGIWSADKKDTDDNPFSAEERKKMLMDVLQAEWLLDKCSIYYLTDLNNNALRRNQIDQELDDFYYLVSDNDYLKTLFADKQHITPETRVNTRGTIIRNAIMQKDWLVLNKYLHPTTLLTLDELHAQEKLEKIFGPEVKKPKNAVDLVLKDADDRVLLIQRKYPPLGRALPGGILDYGETALQGALREGCEELGGKNKASPIEISGKTAKRGTFAIEVIKSLGYRDDPKQDPRRHIISFPFEGRITGGIPEAADDALSKARFSKEQLLAIEPSEWAFVHHKPIILETYHD